MKVLKIHHTSSDILALLRNLLYISVLLKQLLKTTYHYFQDDEDIGDVYQDEQNQAAMLMYKDRDDEALLMVSNEEMEHTVIKQLTNECYETISQGMKEKEDELLSTVLKQLISVRCHKK